MYSIIRNMKKDEYSEVYQILEDSFPATERRTRQAQQSLLNEPAYQIVVCEHEGRVGAFLAYWQLEDFLFIEHFAANPKLRNHGLGGKILQDFLQNSQQRTVLEVEPPETELAKRRIGFYIRNGMTLNTYSYQQPSMAVGQPAIPLLVMSSGGELTLREFQCFRDEVFQKVYHVGVKEGSLCL